MSNINIAINGLGRIGRTIIRAILERQSKGELQNINIVAVNNPGNTESYVHVLEFDSLHGRLKEEISLNSDILTVGRHKMKFFGIKDPSEIPWSDHKVDIVIDATGIFKDQAGLGKHIRGTVKKVIMCAPGNDLDGTFVFGINHEDYDSQNHHIVSNASCTTNCLAPVAKTLHDKYEILNGFMTTVHAYTSDQNILDNSHKDPRRARAAAMSMIPTTTGAAKAVGLVIPELKGKLDGFAIRVPTPDVSLVDLTVNVAKDVTKEDINNTIREASNGHLKGVLGYEEKPLVSIDFLGRSESSIFDPAMTNVLGKTVKIVTWYDNEYGFSNRVADLANHIGSQLGK